MRIRELLCFGATPATGNPALVVDDAPPDPAARQAFARARGSTVVFLDRAAGASPGAASAASAAASNRRGTGDDAGAAASWVLDYYYPHTRSPLCLHATLAAAHVLFERTAAAHMPFERATATANTPPSATTTLAPPPAATPPAPSFPRTREPHFASTPATLTVTTALRAQPLLLSREGDDYYVRLTPEAAPTPARLPDLAALLRQPGLVPASAPRVASVGSPKLLVELADAATLQRLQPDLAAITAWGKEAGVNGIYAWCRHPDGGLEGRNFNHLEPALEDSATGVAAGALTALLGHGLTLLQGRATGRDCLIRTRADGRAILVGGRATARP